MSVRWNFPAGRQGPNAHHQAHVEEQMAGHLWDRTVVCRCGWSWELKMSSRNLISMTDNGLRLLNEEANSYFQHHVTAVLAVEELAKALQMILYVRVVKGEL